MLVVHTIVMSKDERTEKRRDKKIDNSNLYHIFTAHLYKIGSTTSPADPVPG